MREWREGQLRFSFGSILGFLFGFGLFIGSIFIATNDASIFIDIPSVIMVFGGTLSAAFLGYQSRYVWLALFDIVKLFGQDPVNRRMIFQETKNIIRWGHVVKAGGLPALEKELKADDEPFLVYGIELVVSGYSADEVRDMLSQSARSEFGRSSARVDILRAMAGSAPAFGMIGTLVGLVIMLQNLGSDPSAIGGGLAVALMTTLYGILAARLLFLPAATKLQQRSEIKMFRSFLVTEGFALLAEGRSPRFIQDRMNSYLDPAIHIKESDIVGGGGKPAARKK